MFKKIIVAIGCLLAVSGCESMDSTEKREPKFLGFLVVVFLVLVVGTGALALTKAGRKKWSVRSYREQSGQVLRPSAGALAPLAKADAGSYGKKLKQEALSNEAWGRNPFVEVSFDEIENFNKKKINSEDSLAGQFGLTGIFIKGARKVAIINHHFIVEGDTVDEVKVISIEKNKVLLKKDQKELTLEMAGA